MSKVTNKTVAAVALHLLVTLTGANSDTPITRGFLDRDTAVVRADYKSEDPHARKASAGGTPTTAEFRRSPIVHCGINFDGLEIRVGPDCDPAAVGGTLVLTPTCLPTERLADPLFRRSPDPSTPGGWTPWEMVDNGCISVGDIRAAVAQEFQRLPLTPSTLSVQPPSGWTLVNADTVAFADGRTQNLSTTVLGLDVTIRAAPQTYSWSFGDGAAPIVTTDPGRPWPDHTVAHRYSSEGTRSITLTTTWTATFQVAGSAAWEPVDGTATTTSTSPPVTVYEARSRLVSGSAG